MATVYSIKGEFVSAFINYPPEELQKLITVFLENYTDEKSGLKLESINIEVERKWR